MYDYIYREARTSQINTKESNNHTITRFKLNVNSIWEPFFIMTGAYCPYQWNTVVLWYNIVKGILALFGEPAVLARLTKRSWHFKFFGAKCITNINKITSVIWITNVKKKHAWNQMLIYKHTFIYLLHSDKNDKKRKLKKGDRKCKKQMFN